MGQALMGQALGGTFPGPYYSLMSPPSALMRPNGMVPDGQGRGKTIPGPSWGGWHRWYRLNLNSQSLPFVCQVMGALFVRQWCHDGSITIPSLNEGLLGSGTVYYGLIISSRWLGMSPTAD